MKLQIKRGLPGTGKTTEARKAVEESGNTGRLNRDDLRAMLFNSVWTGRREQVVVDCEKAIANVLFQHGLSAIIDDTNLSPGHVEMWKAVAKSVGFNGVQVDILKADIAVAVEQDSQREKPVGKAIIHRMALNAGLIDFGEKPIVIVDVDGTVCNGDHRLSYLEGERKDWKGYFERCVLDTPYTVVIEWVRELSKENTICIVSGRPDTYQKQTIDWLEDNSVPYDFIFMRSGRDKRSDVQVKNDILNKLPKNQIMCALDDRPVVIREVWRANGVKVYPVRGDIADF